MRTNAKVQSLRHVFRSLLAEAKEKDLEPGEDSLDDQIDKYLISYETEAKSAKTEGMDFRMLTRRFLLEADEEEDEGKGEKDEKDKKAKADEETAEGEEAEPQKSNLEDLDMGSFVADVMRLVDNYDSLLEVKNTILRRTVNFLSKNYVDDAAEAFKEELLESYGIEIGQTESEKRDQFMPPKAGAAGPMGGGT